MKSPMHVEEFVEVDVPARTAYNQWTQFESFPNFMEHVEEVLQLDDETLSWKVNVGSKRLHWLARIVEQIPDKRIAWKSMSGPANAGVVTFHRIHDERCRVMLQVQYTATSLLEVAGSALGVVRRAIRSDLQRFKEFLERRGVETGAYREAIPSQDER